MMSPTVVRTLVRSKYFYIIKFLFFRICGSNSVIKKIHILYVLVCSKYVSDGLDSRKYN